MYISKKNCQRRNIMATRFPIEVKARSGTHLNSKSGENTLCLVLAKANCLNHCLIPILDKKFETFS